MRPMSVCTRLSHAFVIALAVAASVEAAAGDAVPVRLTLLADRYVVDAQVLPDLAAVDRWTREHTLRIAAIDRCPSATSHRFATAVERYAAWDADPLEVRAVPAGVAGCTDEASSLAGWLRAQDYTQTDAEGRSLIP